MVSVTAKDVISLESVLKEVTEAEIFRHFLGFDYELGKLYHSPLRKDARPSFNIYANGGHLYFKDFGGEHGSVFKFVCAMEMMPYNLYDALRVINKKMGLGLYDFKGGTMNMSRMSYPSYQKQFESSSSVIKIRSRKATDKDIQYWSSGFISMDTLDKYHVVPTEEVWLQKGFDPFKLLWINTDDNPIYTYMIEDKKKCYRPKDQKGNKWLSTTKFEHIQGFEQLSYRTDTLFITKSLKDVMVLDELKLDAIAPQSEHSALPSDKVAFLKDRFERIVVFYDNDDPGVKGSVKLTGIIGAEYFNLPKKYLEEEMIKDSFDFVCKYGQDKLLDLINQKIQWKGNNWKNL